MLNKLIGILLMLICSACSTDNWTPKYVVASDKAYVKFGDVPQGKIGYTYFHFDESDVLIQKGLSNQQLKVLITHELFHVAGYIGHIQDDKNCYFYHSPKISLSSFCDKDIKLLKNIKKDKPIIICSIPELSEHTIYAINLLNNAANREIFKWGGIK